MITIFCCLQLSNNKANHNFQFSIFQFSTKQTYSAEPPSGLACVYVRAPSSLSSM